MLVDNLLASYIAKRECESNGLRLTGRLWRHDQSSFYPENPGSMRCCTSLRGASAQLGKAKLPPAGPSMLGLPFTSISTAQTCCSKKGWRLEDINSSIFRGA